MKSIINMIHVYVEVDGQNILGIVLSCERKQTQETEEVLNV